MLRTVLVAAASVAVVVGGGFGLQAGALGRPAHARLELVRTLHRLTEYHRSQAAIELNGRRYDAACGEHWFPHARVAEVVIDRWEVLPEVGNRLLRKSVLADVQFDLAGCPRPLVIWLSSQLLRDADVRLRVTKADGIRVYALRLPAARPALELFVGRETHLPVELVLEGGRLRGTSDVSYGAPR